MTHWESPLCLDEFTGLLHAAPGLPSSLPDASCIWQSRRKVAEMSDCFAPATHAYIFTIRLAPGIRSHEIHDLSSKRGPHGVALLRQ